MLLALVGMAQWLVNQKVSSSIPRQGTCLSCGPGPQLGACERQLFDVSLPFSLPSPLSKNKINKTLKKKHITNIQSLR